MTLGALPPSFSTKSVESGSWVDGRKRTFGFAPIAAARPSPTASHKQTFEAQLSDGVVADLKLTR